MSDISNYPNSYDSLPDPTTGDVVSSAWARRINDILEKIENKLGLGAVTPAASGQYFQSAAPGGTSTWASLRDNGLGLRLSKLSAALANPGTDTAVLYLRPGTNANTVKLVIRAGAGGAETTILDNIPVGTVAPSSLVNETFASTASVWPSATWVDQDQNDTGTASSTIPSVGVGRMAITNNGTNTAARQTTVSSIAIPADAEVLCPVTFPTAGSCRVWLRASGTQTNRVSDAGYCISLDVASSSFTLRRSNGASSGATTQLGTGYTITLTPGSKFWIRFRVQGSSVMGKVWLDGTTEPTDWLQSVTDTTYTAAGRASIFAWLSTASASGNVDFGTITVTDQTTGGSSGGTSTPVSALRSVYVGSGNTAGLDAYESWLGVQTTWWTDYLDGSSWANISDPSWFTSRWASRPRNQIVGVPILPSPTNGATFALGAAGNYDSYFTLLAQRLVAQGFGSSVIRMAWEFNGNWMPWSVSDSVTGMHGTDFIAYWQRLVGLFRAQSTNFKFCWNPTLGTNYYDPENAYPGDSYVDYIGLDHYDGGTTAHPTFSERWSWYRTQARGLDWHVTFSTAHNKPMTFDEWGLWAPGWSGGGGGDDPAFIQAVYDWITTHNFAYASFWQNPGDPMIFATGGYPNSAALYKSLFG